MNKTLKWQLYVSFYTFCFGIPLLFFPNAIIPYFGFPSTREPWIHLVGMFLLGLCYISTMVYTRRIVGILLYSIFMRAWFACVFTVLALVGHPPFLYLAAGIIWLGVAGSTFAYLSERDTHMTAGFISSYGGERP